MRALAAAVSFLTRVPVPVPFEEEDVHRASVWFPVVGGAIGASTAAVAGRTTPELGLAFEALLTGALHLDALADVADGAGAHTRERALEIMRDPRVGSFGTTALVLHLMIKRSLLGQASVPTAMAAGALSRAVPVAVAAALPYARAEGTGAVVASGGSSQATTAAATAALLALAAGPRRAARRIGVAAGVGAASAVVSRRWLGGYTGDTLGAGVELVQLAVLACR